jgi:hypothetical protein
VRLTVACVLRSGGDFRREHVQWLAHQVGRRLQLEHQVVCLSDVAVPGVDTVPMRRGWPGWWSKLELFEHFRQAFYLDLDTAIVGDLAPLVTHPHVFTMLRDVSGADRPASGVMAWNGNRSAIAEAFAADPDRWIAECSSATSWGDQGFIARHVRPDFLQDLFPGCVQSFKLDLKGGAPGSDTRIVAFHGTPRPWDVKAAWLDC